MAHPTPQRAAHRPAVAVVRFDGEARLVATEPHPTGSSILELEGALADGPSRWSIQIGLDLHLQPLPGIEGDDPRCPWRFLNHACRPNAFFQGHRLIAARSIAAGEEITFHYATTEWAMAEPFRCRCLECVDTGGRRIAGYRDLEEAERERLHPFATEHVRTLRRLFERLGAER